VQGNETKRKKTLAKKERVVSYAMLTEPRGKVYRKRNGGEKKEKNNAEEGETLGPPPTQQKKKTTSDEKGRDLTKPYAGSASSKNSRGVKK